MQYHAVHAGQDDGPPLVTLNNNVKIRHFYYSFSTYNSCVIMFIGNVNPLRSILYQNEIFWHKLKI